MHIAPVKSRGAWGIKCVYVYGVCMSCIVKKRELFKDSLVYYNPSSARTAVNAF